MRSSSDRSLPLSKEWTLDSLGRLIYRCGDRTRKSVMLYHDATTLAWSDQSGWLISPLYAVPYA